MRLRGLNINLLISMKFLSFEITFYFYKLTMQPFMEYFCHIQAGNNLCKLTVQPSMEYFCHIQAGTTNYYLEILDKAQKWVCKAVGPTLVAWFIVKVQPAKAFSVGVTLEMFI